MSEQIFCRWHNQYGSMKANEMKRLKRLEAENRRLKKLVAVLSLHKEILKDAPWQGERLFRPDTCPDASQSARRAAT